MRHLQATLLSHKFCILNSEGSLLQACCMSKVVIFQSEYRAYLLHIQVHCTGKVAAEYGTFRQRWMQTAEAVVRQAGAAVPPPTSMLYSASTAIDGPAATCGEDGGSSLLLQPPVLPVANVADADTQLQLPSNEANTAEGPS